MLRFPSLAAIGAALLLASAAGPADAQTTIADGLRGPFRLAQLADGRVLVSEGRVSDGASGDRVTAFNAAGGDRGVFASALTDPTDILQLADGRVLIAVQSAGGRLAAFSTSGAVQDIFATGLGTPRDVIQLSTGRLLVVDGADENGRVVELNADGSVRNASFISGLKGPGGIVRLADGRLLVTEAGAQNRVLAYTADGAPIGTFASGLGSPSDILQVADGRVLVVNVDDTPGNNNTDPDAADGSVSIFSPDGTLLGTLADDLVRPAGLLQLSDGSVLVSVFGTANAGSVLSFGLPTSAGPGGPALATIGVPSPNPAVGTSTLAVAVETSQRVRVSVYDVLGREAAVAFDGPVAAGASALVTLDLAGLAPGAYVVRVGGETFTEARRLTVVR